MYSNSIVVNCPGCETALESDHTTGMMQCPYCDRRFNVEEGIKIREILMQREIAKEENLNKMMGIEPPQNDTVSGKAKFCTECGRKLAFDARFCDMCGVRVNTIR